LAIDGLVGTPQGIDHRLAPAAPLHALIVHAVSSRRVAARHHIGGDVFQHQRAACRHGEVAEVAELVHAGHAAEDHAAAHMYVTGDGGVVGEDAIVGNHAVVRHVHIGHQQVVAADARQGIVLYRAAMNGDTLANDVVVAYLEA